MVKKYDSGSDDFAVKVWGMASSMRAKSLTASLALGSLAMMARKSSAAAVTAQSRYGIPRATGKCDATFQGHSSSLIFCDQPRQ